MKKVIALFLAFVFSFSAFSSIGIFKINAASYTTPPDKSESQVVAKINTLVELLDGKYFTTTQQSCGNSSCTRCQNAKVFEAAWFKALFGEVSVSQISGHAYPGGGSGYALGWSCHGFANFALWYVFSSSNTDKITYERVADNVTLTESNIKKYAKPGDIIRYQTASSGHSVMFIDADENGITVIDCNARVYPDAHCCVRKHRISYNDRAMAISRATNYVDTPTLSIEYNANGGELASSEPYGTRYKVESSNGLNMRSGPGTSYKIIGGLANSAIFDVNNNETASANGYVWGKTTSGTQSGWVVISNYVSKVSDLYDCDYFIKDSILYYSSNSKPVDNKMTYGKEYNDGLLDAVEIGLIREEYRFVGWSTEPDGEVVFEPNRAILPEEILPQLSNGSAEITLYAIWQSTHVHSMSEWIPLENSNNHIRQCRCGYAESDIHIWSTKENSSTEAYKCIYCGAEHEGEPENGLYTVDGITYYYENSVKIKGFFTYEGKKYYASEINLGVIARSGSIGGVYYIWNDLTGLEVANGFVKTENGTVCYEKGKQVIGWRHSDGTGPKVEGGISEQYSQNPENLFYFLSTTGYMVTEESYMIGGYTREFNEDHTVKPLDGFQTKSGLVYYYEDGVMQTGWHEFDGVTYYFMSSDAVYGQAATKWMYIGNKIYYFYASTSSNPYALKTEGTIGGIEYTYGEDGRILYTGFVNCEYANAKNNNSAENIQKKNSTTRYYVNGEMQTGWQYIDGFYYYFYAEGSVNGSGYMCTESRYIGGIWYEFTSEGICLNK